MTSLWRYSDKPRDLRRQERDELTASFWFFGYKVLECAASLHFFRRPEENAVYSGGIFRSGFGLSFGRALRRKGNGQFITVLETQLARVFEACGSSRHFR